MIRDFGKFLMLICFSLIESFRNLLSEAQFCVRVHEIINSPFWGVEAPGQQGAKTPEYLDIPSFCKAAGRDASASKM